MNILVSSIIDLRRSAYSRLIGVLSYLSRQHNITVIGVKDYWKLMQNKNSNYIVGFEEIFDKIEILYITDCKIPTVYQEPFSIFRQLTSLKSLRYDKFDVHLNYNSLFLGYQVAKSMKKIGKNTVYDIADNLPKMIHNSPQIPSFLRPLGGRVGKYMLDRNIEISSRVTYVTSNLATLYPSAGKSEIVQNCVDSDLFNGQYDSRILRKKLNLNGSFVIGFVGALREWVDFEVLFQSVKELLAEGNNIKILIVGGEGFLEKNQLLARQKGISDNVVFTGTIPYADVSKYHTCMDICVMPLNFSQAQPLALLQYLSSERAVISSKIIADIPDDIILYTSNLQEYKQTVLRLMRDIQFRNQIAHRGREYILQHHSLEVIGKRFEDLLLDIYYK
jgi:glycosyltransferase involved in cell wall biosynthesis